MEQTNVTEVAVADATKGTKRLINESYVYDLHSLTLTDNANMRENLIVGLKLAFDDAIKASVENRSQLGENANYPAMELRRNSIGHGLGYKSSFVFKPGVAQAYKFAKADGTSAEVEVDADDETQYVFSVSLNPVRVVQDKVAKSPRQPKATKVAVTQIKAQLDVATEEAKWTRIASAIYEQMVEVVTGGEDFGLPPTQLRDKASWGGMTKKEWIDTAILNHSAPCIPSFATNAGEIVFNFTDAGQVTVALPDPNAGKLNI